MRKKKCFAEPVNFIKTIVIVIILIQNDMLDLMLENIMRKHYLVQLMSEMIVNTMKRDQNKLRSLFGAGYLGDLKWLKNYVAFVRKNQLNLL
jgi:hypothetical protein